MRANATNIVLGIIGVASLASLGLGWLWGAPVLTGGGSGGLVYVVTCLALGQHASRDLAALARRRRPKSKPAAKAGARKPADPGDKDAMVEQMLAQGRYALLLRPQIAENLSEHQFHRALEALENGMALVPDGEVVLGRIDDLDPRELEDEDVVARQGRIVRVEHFFMDRYPVTNRQYYEFVAAGGYEQMALWDPAIWPAVLDFVDRTGEPGPRFWEDGCHAEGRERHPVVGVSWYEAAAYARWLGKRLPTDAEWVKAGSWPVSLSSSSRVQRRYPWGDTMDLTRANLWASGRRDTVSVDEFSGGVSVGGVYQLIGNVWQWTRGDYRAAETDGTVIVSEAPIKSIRGGAFDTYFDSQATCQFQSGEAVIGRKPNIGFRCAVGVCDLLLALAAAADSSPVEAGSPSLEEVQA